MRCCVERAVKIMDTLTIFSLGTMLVAHRLTIIWRSSRKFDSWGHLFFVTAVQEQRSGFTNSIDMRVVEGGPFHYPLFVHWCLSWIPREFLLRHAGLINPVVEAVCVVALLSWFHAIGLPMDILVWTFMVYMLTPLMFSKVAVGPNVTQFTTRIYSELTATMVFALAISDGFLPWAVEFSVFAALIAFIVLSSKFGMQVIVLILFPTSILVWKLSLVFGVVAGFGLALLISRAQLINILRAQIQHLVWYFRNMRNGSLPMANRTNFAFLWSGRLTLQDRLVKLVIRNPYTAMLIKAPVFLLTPLWAWLVWRGDGAGTWTDLIVFMVVSYVIFVLTIQKPFLFLGEGERYVSHFGLLHALLFVLAIQTAGAPAVLWFAVFYGALYWTVEVYVFGVRRYREADFDEERVTAFLRSLPDETVVLSYPYHVAPPWRLLVETKLRPIFPVVATGPGATRLKEWENYPYMDLAHIDALREEFGLQVIVAQDSKMTDESRTQAFDGGWPLFRLPGATLALHPDLALYAKCLAREEAGA